MTSFRLPQIQDVPSASQAERAAILDSLFEPSQSLRLLCNPLLRDNVYPSYEALTDAVQLELVKLAKSTSDYDKDKLTKILSSHARLGEKKVESAQSQAEQAQLNSPNETETAKLAKMNDLYEKTFTALRYVAFVAGRSRSLILQDMERRIDRGEFDAEKIEAINAMRDIALDRAHKSGG